MKRNPVVRSRLREIQPAPKGRRVALDSFFDLGRVPRVGERVLVKTKNLTGVMQVALVHPTHVLFEQIDEESGENWGGMWQVSMRDIYPLERRSRRNPDPDVEEAERIYRETHWGDEPEGVKTVPKIERRPPRIGTAMGEVAKIVYRTSKGGEDAYFEHEFEGELPVLVFGRPNGSKRNRLYFVGGDYDVDADGIRG